MKEFKTYESAVFGAKAASIEHGLKPVGIFTNNEKYLIGIDFPFSSEFLVAIICCTKEFKLVSTEIAKEKEPKKEITESEIFDILKLLNGKLSLTMKKQGYDETLIEHSLCFKF